MILDLPAAIRNQIDYDVTQIKGSDPDTFEGIAANDMGLALLAVLDRHQPIPIGYGEDATYICGSCRFFTSEWPCPELVDVAEALGI